MSERVVKKVRPGMSGILKIRRLVLTTFPQNERPPFNLLLLRTRLPDAEFLAFYEKKELCGITVTIQNDDAVLLSFLAVCEEKRSQGIGSELLKYVKKRHSGKLIVADIEALDPHAADIADRVRRKRFYIKNGFEELHAGFAYGGADYELMGIGGGFDENKLRRLYLQMTMGVFDPQLYRI